jgi:hypothetical protein
MRRHVVVDGSNIATEGRAMPSLKQLNDAVLAYIEEHPDDLVTVVVDATFGHRIDPKEVADFDAAVENNELVSPPAGAIGRGDAFVLTIANKANATVLSNDSFQEFHGDYPWLFDEGRLLGGKPVPHVGWVFVPRAPVRGPVSRKARRDAQQIRTPAKAKSRGRPSKLASEPLPEPKTPPPGRKAAKEADGQRKAAVKAAPAAGTDAPTGAPKHAPINALLPFLSFVEHHPVGSAVEASVESYSSHGAYVRVGDVRAYVPLRYLGRPAPRSAREVLAMGVSLPFTVVSFNAPRRGIDLAMPGFEPAAAAAPVEPVVEPVAPPAKKVSRARKKAAEAPPAEPVEAPVKKRTRKKAAEAPAAEPVKEPVKKVTRSRKKAAEPALVPPPVAGDGATPADKPVKKATKSRKKAAAPAAGG